ncbi:MAG: FAD-binding protein [Gemmatimonadales bacterium]|nr:MAG: FAD-binding protein [Gemmatimonadales bacterium]
MARTPLFRQVRRALRLAQRSLITGESPSELVEKARHPLSRRRFVGLSSAAIATVALQGCTPIFRRSSDEPVLIIGAGIAGLSAGYRLRQAGVPVRIIEAQNRTGGRMLSLRNYFADGQVAELGGELVDTNHVHMHALAAELGIEFNDLAQDDPSKEEVYFFGGQRYSEAEVVEAFLPVARRIQAALEELDGDGDVTWADPLNGERLDRMSIAEWFDGAEVTGWIRTLLDVAYTTEYGLEIDRQSALNFLLMIDPEPDPVGPFHIFGESDERFHVRGGNDRITQALAERVEDAIELETRLEAVRMRSDGAYVASLRRGETAFEASARHLILALPFTLLRQVQLDLELPPVKRRAIEELGYGTNAKLMVGFSDRLWRTDYDANGATLSDLPFQLTWETSRLQDGDAGILTNFTGGDHGVSVGRGSASEQATALVTDLEQVYPGIRATREGMREARFHWPSHPWTLGSYASYLTGQWTGFRGEEGRPVGRLYFAGEHCSPEAQGFMEGGLETGEAAAADILSDMGLPSRLARRPLAGTRI